jgi:hypothetical protein
MISEIKIEISTQEFAHFKRFIKNSCKMPDLAVLCYSSCGHTKPHEDFIMQHSTQHSGMEHSMKRLT